MKILYISTLWDEKGRERWSYDKKINLSVIIPTKNRENDLIDCLESILIQDYLPKEVIIIDQGSEEGLFQELKPLIPEFINLIYIYDNKNISGLTQAKNLGISKAKGDFILFLDDDIIMLKYALKNVLDIFQTDIEKRIGGVGGFIVNEKPPIIFRFAGIFFQGPFAFYKDQSLFQWKAMRGKELLQESRMIPGGASCVRAEVFKKFRFDDNLFGYSYGEDSIFGYLVSSRYKLFLYSGFKFYHKRFSSPRDDKKKDIHMQIIWWFYFFSKYVKKTIFNYLCYIWSLIGITCKILINFYNFEIMKGAISALKRILRIILKKSKMEIELRDYLS